MADGALRSHFVGELRVGNSSSLGFVEFLDNLSGLLVANVESAGLNEPLKLISGHGTVVVQIAGVERLVDVKARLALESLADGLGGGLGLEVNSPDISELDLSVRQEAIVASVKGVSVVRGASVHHMGIVSVESGEGVGELVEGESTVTVGVVAGHEELNFLGGGVHTDGGKTVTEVGDRNVAAEILIENLEGVLQVEVALEGKRSLA